jgi:hypothetical protein
MDSSSRAFAIPAIGEGGATNPASSRVRDDAGVAPRPG